MKLSVSTNNNGKALSSCEPTMEGVQQAVDLVGKHVLLSLTPGTWVPSDNAVKRGAPVLVLGVLFFDGAWRLVTDERVGRHSEDSWAPRLAIICDAQVVSRTPCKGVFRR